MDKREDPNFVKLALALLKRGADAGEILAVMDETRTRMLTHAGAGTRSRPKGTRSAARAR